VEPDRTATVTIDELASATGTTARRIRSLQTLGLVPYPVLRGRTGLYDESHRDRVESVLRLQRQGFSLESLVVLFDALAAGRSLTSVLGATSLDAATGDTDHEADSADLYGFAELQPIRSSPRRGRLSVVPTTVWVDSRAS
jgi:DNA-binding transcriptional MerR regulator